MNFKDILKLNHGEGISDEELKERNELTNAILLSHQISYLWWRVIDSLKVTKLYGGFLRTVFVTIGKLFLFIIFFYGFILLITGVFNLLFQQYVTFSNYFNSFFYLAQAALQDYELIPIWSKYLKFALIFFMIICTLILMNLIIALATRIYDDVDENITPEHRGNLIKIYEYMRGDENYAIFKFLHAPFNVIQLPFSLIVLFADNKVYWNEVGCKISFLFIGLFYFIIFVFFNTIRMPYILIKQILINSFKYNSSFTKLCTWIIIGWFYMIYYYILDIIYYWYYVFREQTQTEKPEELEHKNIAEMRQLYSVLISEIADMVDNNRKSQGYSVVDIISGWLSRFVKKPSMETINRMHKKSIMHKKLDKESISSKDSIRIRSMYDSQPQKVSIFDHFRKILVFVNKFINKDG